MRKIGVTLMIPTVLALSALTSAAASAQTKVNAVVALGKIQASGCNGKNSYVLLWASTLMWAPKGSDANMVSNATGVLQIAAQDCMAQGYVPSGGVTYARTDPAYYYQPMVLKSATESAAVAAQPSPGASSPASH